MDSPTYASHCVDASEIKNFISCDKWWIRAAAAQNPSIEIGDLLTALEDESMYVRKAAAHSMYRILQPMGMVNSMDSSLWVESAANDPVFSITVKANLIHNGMVSKKEVLSSIKKRK